MKIGTSRLAALPSAASRSGSTTYVESATMPARRSAWRTPCRARSRRPARIRRGRCARGDAARFLARDERLDLSLRCLHAGHIGAASDVARRDVVPGPHPKAVVERDRPHRRMRKHEADGSDSGSLISPTIGTKSLPSAPRPCSQMTAAVGLVRSRVRCTAGVRRSWGVSRALAAMLRRRAFVLCGGHPATAAPRNSRFRRHRLRSRAAPTRAAPAREACGRTRSP